jgi:hypothetical protein
VHGQRQKAIGVDVWWRLYIDDANFRLEEEVLAHRAEYEHECRTPGADKPTPGFRSRSAYMLHQIANRLACRLYGNMITAADARLLITGTYKLGDVTKGQKRVVRAA